MNVLELFAGIGGTSLGLERAGLTIVGHVEKDPYCRSVLSRHWPEVPQHDDVRTTVEWWSLRPDRPPVDIVSGGFPCQPFSTAANGFRRGVHDERWGWPWFYDVVRALRPRYVFVENVTGLLSWNQGEAFGIILADLADLGMHAQWTVLSACALGAPHRRRRLCLVAHPPIDVGTSWMAPEGWVPVRPAVHGGSRYWADRGVGVREAARGDGRVFDGAARRMVKAGGNAVVPAMAEHIGRWIIQLDEQLHCPGAPEAPPRRMKAAA